MRRGGLLVGCVLVLLAVPAHAGAVGLQPVGTFNAPIFVTSTPGDPRLFVVERGGTIQVLHDGTTTEYLDISAMVDTTGERGLLSIAFDPGYASNGLFYVFFNDDGDGGAAVGDIHVDEFRVGPDPNTADPASRRRVLTLVRGTSASNHNGGQLQFGKDGLLYVSVGDAANAANAQALGNPHGKILRIDPHGSADGEHGVPGNPFVGTPGAVPEIWSLGLRNPYRFSFDHLTGDIAIGDVGAGSFEEIDYVPASAGTGGGANYGWPLCEGFQGNCPGTIPPVFAYAHSDPCNAVIGGYVYRGSQVPELSGRYLYTDLCHNELRSIQLATPLAADDRSEGLTLPANPVSFGEDASCELYLAAGSSVQRIVGSGASAAPGCVSGAPGCVPGAPGCVSAAPVVQTTVPKKKKKGCKRKRKRREATAAIHQGKKHKKRRCKKRRKKKRLS
ncbi:MAG TPA: PQQ-dependent sugar dehydrogenase [Solirubrobacterales bacterium]